MKTTRNKTIGLCVAAVVLLGHLSFAERLWPLQVGQTYMYTRSEPLGDSWPVQMKVDKYIIYNSQTYFSYGFYNYDNDGKLEDQGYARSTEDFVYYSPGDDHIAFQKASVGTKWIIYDAPWDEYIVTEIVAIEPVTVPYGYFEEAYIHRNYICDDPYDPGSWKSPYWYEWIVPGVGYVKQVDHWVDSMTPWIMELDDIIQNTEPVSITKFTAKAGKSAGTDSVQFSGVLGAVGLEVLVADEIVISLDADAMAAPLEWTFPINASTLKNGNFNAKTADSSFRYSIKNGKMTFSAKNANLAGLACPLKVTITIGDSSESIELDTAIVNGPKKPCPPQFLMGVRNSMTVDRAQVKFGKKPNTDSLTVRGFFTLADDGYDKNNPMIVWLGGQTFTVSGQQFKDGKFSESCTNAVSDEGPLVKAKFDFAKCTFQIQVRNMAISDYGVVPLGLMLFDQDLTGFATIDLGPKQSYTFWELTGFDQSTARWDYDTNTGDGWLRRAVHSWGSNNFRVTDDESDAWAHWIFQKHDENAYFSEFLIVNDWGEEILFEIDESMYYPENLRVGQSHSSVSSVTGSVDLNSSYIPVIPLSGTAKTTVTLSPKFTSVSYGGTGYLAIQLTEVMDFTANIHHPYNYAQILGVMKVKITTKSNVVPGLGATSFSRQASIRGAGIKETISQKAVLVDTNMD